MTERNEGISISGGDVRIDGQVAVGRGARAIMNTYDISDRLRTSGDTAVAQALTDLLEALEIHRNSISGKAEVAETIQQIAEETQKEKPNKITVQGLLAGLTQSLGSVVEIAEKISVLKKVIGLMIGFPSI